MSTKMAYNSTSDWSHTLFTLLFIVLSCSHALSQDIPARVTDLEQSDESFKKELSAMKAEMATLKSTVNTLAQENEALKEQAAPVGTIQAYAGDKIPDNWKLCDGAELDQSAFPKLFNAIGKAWGGSGIKFRLPDLRGRFLRGVSGTSGADPDKDDRTSLNSNGNKGNQVGSYQEGAFESHGHPLNKDKNVIEYYQKNPPNGSATAYPSTWHSNRYNSSETGYHVGETGGRETRPTNAYVQFIIKYE